MTYSFRKEDLFEREYWNWSGLGSGTYSSVHKVIGVVEGKTKKYVVKRVRIPSTGNTRAVTNKVNLEVDIFRKVGNHKRIVRFIAYFGDKKYLNIALEFCRDGSLADIYDVYREYTETTVREITMQICEGLLHLNKFKIAHRDIKPENILVRCYDPVDVCLADFNVSKSAEIMHTQANLFRTCMGTPGYLAPEVVDSNPEIGKFQVFLGDNRRDWEDYEKGEVPLRKLYEGEYLYNEKCDIWSLGVVVYELLSGRWKPFELTLQTQDLMKIGFDGNEDEWLEICRIKEQALQRSSSKLHFSPFQQWEMISEPAKEVVQRMLISKPDDRISAAEITASGWGNNMSTFSLYNHENYMAYKAKEEEGCFLPTMFNE